MRRRVGKPVTTRKGDLVTVVMRLPRGVSTDARLSVWSALAGDEMSPHVQHSAIGLLIDSRPSMVPPMYVRLTPKKPRFTLQFTADEDLTFCIIQDVDAKDEPLAKVRITGHGKAWQRTRRFLQDTLGFLRGRSAKGLGRHA